jgi:AraC-like DNA-binding protein
VAVLDLIAALFIRKAREDPPGSVFKTQVGFLLVYLLTSFIMLAGCLARSDRLLSFGLALLGLEALCFTLTCTTIVYFIERDIPSRLRTDPTRPDWDAAAPDIAARLQKAIDGAGLYRDADLTLDRLAQELGVDPKRLSYHFKTFLGTNFRGYINDLRLRAVCRDLCESPAASILDIALKSGFNSKSSFNSLFIKAYGVTPREYRARNCV